MRWALLVAFLVLVALMVIGFCEVARTMGRAI